MEKKHEILIVFDNMITDMLIIWLLRHKATHLIIIITQSYFVVPKNIKLNATHYFVIKISNKRELQQIAFNHSSDIDFNDFMNLYKKCTAKPYSSLVIDATVVSDNPLHFRNSILERI